MSEQKSDGPVFDVKTPTGRMIVRKATVRDVLKEPAKPRPTNYGELRQDIGYDPLGRRARERGEP